MNDNNFNLALKFLFPSEGGYVNNKNDRGGPTNMGVTQSTYNRYRNKYNLPYKDVAKITRDEAKQIYYENYWIVSGANKIQDPRMAIVVFDTAVLHGPYQAKTFYNSCNGNLDRYYQLRKNFYAKRVVDDPSQKVFYNGWINRVNNLKKYVDGIPNNQNNEQDEVEFSILLKGGIETSDIEEAQKEQFKSKNNLPTGYAADIDSHSESECSGNYPVSGYTRSDGTKVNGYTRNCYKHNGKIPKLTNLSAEEIDWWVARLI